MARKLSAQDPALSLDFFISGFYTYRSQLFAPYKPIGVNVITFRDPVLDGNNFELTDKLEWTRRPGFSIFCPTPLADSEVVNQFYSSRNLNGVVLSFVDTSARLATFTSASIMTVLNKTTTNQGYLETIGNLTYFADGAPADLSVWDGTNAPYAWGLAPPTVEPTSTGMGFWQPFTTFALGDTILDSNGSLETVTAILVPNGAFESPTVATTTALGGSLSLTWAPDSIHGGYFVTEGYRHIQQGSAYSGASTSAAILFTTQAVTVGDVIVVSIGSPTVNFTPSVVSVTDNLGNTYSLQAHAAGTYVGGGGTDFNQNEWVYSAPVTTGGACTVTVALNTNQFQILAHEVSGINATSSTNNFGYVVNGGPPFSTGSISFSGTQFVYSALMLDSGEGLATSPVDYTPGASISVAEQLSDAYSGPTTSASPTWTLPSPSSFSGLALGLTVAFPITSLTTGYTPYLFLSSFNLGIPNGATIVGIQVDVPKFNAGTGTVQDQSVRLVIGGTVVGNDYASATTWNNAAYTVATYGGPTDTWGLSPTAAQLNANGLSGFGVVLSALISSTTGGSVTPEVGFNSPNQPTVTVYFKQASGFGGPGISGANEPIWATTLNSSVNDGGVTWTNYGPILTWFPATGYPTPVVILDTNGNLQLSTYVANPIAAWDVSTGYMLGDVVYFGGQYWISIFNGTNTGVPPSVNYATTGSSTTVPYWALTTTPLVTGLNAPVWNTVVGGTTVDGSYTWTNIGQGSGLAFLGYAYVYAYRTVGGHLTTGSPYSNNTGAILGPLNASITSFAITANVVTFQGTNNFLPGNVFRVNGLSIGTYFNNQAFTVVSAIPSETFPLTMVAVNGADVLTITAANNLVVGQTVTFSGVGTATFLNGVTVTVLSSGLSSSQFEANFTHASYGPAADSGNVNANGSYTAKFTHADVSLTLDSGAAIPLISTITGFGTGSALCNSTATITAVKVVANIVTIYASNNFQPGIWVTLTGLTGATFLNAQQLQVIAVDQPVGTQNTWFQVYFQTPNYMLTADTGLATFNAIEIYRTSDGGGIYLFDGAVTNPGAGFMWAFDDFVVDADLDILLVAPLNHQNDPPPGAPGSIVTTVSGTVLAYWQGRLWMAAGNFVYFDAGPDCTNGIPEQAWPPANRFQFAGPVFGLEPTPDGVGLLVYLADRVAAILGGPETISFSTTDALSNFGVSNSNALFRDGSTIGHFTTQRQYIELVGTAKDDIGEHIGDYLDENFDAAKAYATLHRDGLDVGVFLSNGIDRIVRFGSNIQAWSVPAFPAFGAGALQSIETSVGVYSLMTASPTGGKTAAVGPTNPTSGTNVAIGGGAAWLTPSNITLGNPADYATTTFTASNTSQVLRASAYVPLAIPNTAVVQGVRVTLLGKQTTTSNLTVTITPTNGGVGATSHTFNFGTSNTTVMWGGAMDLWGMPWSQPYLVSNGALSFDITATNTGGGTPEVFVAEVQVTVIYQNPGNYLYARDLNSWGDDGVYGQNNGTPYPFANIVIGSITLSQPGALMFPLQHVVGYFDAVGTLNNGGPSYPQIWILPNEVNDTAGIGFIQLPEALQEPPEGQNKPSGSILALRYPVNMMNSYLASQFVHHLQVKIQFEPELAPNTIKSISFKEDQS